MSRAILLRLFAFICVHFCGSDSCGPWFTPPAPPERATALNGVALPNVCFNDSDKAHHVFVIGDWGGISYAPGASPIPADQREKKHFPNTHRPFVRGVDDAAQIRVAAQMRARAPESKPDYILNAGDSFYWGGLKTTCGQPLRPHIGTDQFHSVFERIYVGEGIDGIQWLGVLGNHDYGGFKFTKGWDQMISYTWGGPQSSGRWVMPGQYWRVKVLYPDLAVDYYFVDSNVFDAYEPHADPGHNLCGKKNNEAGASCKLTGPTSVWDCATWFERLWLDQMRWLEDGLRLSYADWQVVVTHFPPEWGKEDWQYLSKTYGIDLIVTGHRHCQEVWPGDDASKPGGEENFLRPTTWIVSGGGGGITSQGLPEKDGGDDMYGFMDLTILRSSIKIEAVSHGGQLRSTTHALPVLPGKRPQTRHRFYKEEDFTIKSNVNTTDIHT